MRRSSLNLLMLLAAAVALTALPARARQLPDPAAFRLEGEAAALWARLTGPATAHAERMEIARQRALAFPPEHAPTIVRAIRELRHEEAMHGWGLMPHPHDALPSARAYAWNTVERDRTVLGRPWRLPDEKSPFPTTPDAEAAAPWPWQVRQALEQALVTMASHGTTGASRDWFVPRYMAACMTMPVGTDDEACAFVEATLGGSWMNHKSMPVIARWRRIALAADKPQAAVMVAQRLGQTGYLWPHPHARHACELIMAEVIRGSPVKNARSHAAYGIRYLRDTATVHAPRATEPLLAIVAAAEQAADEGAGDEWDRLYVYAYSAAEAMDAPPIEVKRSFDGPRPDSVEAAQRLEEFCNWFKGSRDDLLRRARERERALAPVLAELESAGKGD